jgi:hypothetical protein
VFFISTKHREALCWGQAPLKALSKSEQGSGDETFNLSPLRENGVGKIPCRFEDKSVHYKGSRNFNLLLQLNIMQSDEFFDAK